MMMLYVFIHGLTGRIFKILPLKEDTDSGKDVHLVDYIHSLARDAIGASVTFPELAQMQEYITVINTLQYLESWAYDHATCKQEVFKMLRLLNTIESRLGGDKSEPKL